MRTLPADHLWYHVLSRSKFTGYAEANLLMLSQSPRYLCETDRNEEAMQVLRKLHFDGTNEDWIEREFNEMRLTIEAEKAITAPGWAIMFKVDPWRTRLFHATSIQLFGQMTG
jgi:hypothetical protein